MSTRFTATIMGTGTSAGVPVVACQCAVCTSNNPRNHRLRCSVLLRNAEQSILIDCGSDFRQQALHYRILKLDAILLTHAHSDHVAGMDEIRLYNWLQERPMPLYASAKTLSGIRTRFDYIFNPMQPGGGVPDLDIHEIDDAPFDVLGNKIIPLPVMHGRLPVTGFRIGNFGYITDASQVPPETIERLSGVRWLILNALRHRPHPTHLNIEQATAIAQKIGAERTWFTHITHDLDHDETNAMLPPNIQLAHDGLEVEVDAG